MSDQPNTTPLPPGLPGPEDQRERWLKYGVNVVLTCVIVLAIAIVAVWGAQRYRGRTDMTIGGSQSLRPQTISVIKDTTSKITLVSLYPRLKQDEKESGQDLYQPVVDKLEEYRREGKNIDVRVIDPIGEPGKLAEWIADLKTKYGGNLKAYEDVLRGFPEALKKIGDKAKDEATKLSKVVADVEDALPDLQNKAKLMPREEIVKLNEALQSLPTARSTALNFPRILDALNEDIKADLEPKIPDYSDAIQKLKLGMESFSAQCDSLIKRFGDLKTNTVIPEGARQYATDAIPRFEEMKKLADDELVKTKNLGDLKLDDVRRKVIPPDDGTQPSPAIAVMGENDVRVIGMQSAWQSGESTGLTGTSSDRPKLRFSGEQQITAAILALQQPKKTKIAFIRAGGPAMTSSPGGMFGGGEAPMAEMAERLKNYNYDIVEKDITGQAAMAAQQRGMPPMPEPTDEEIKDALWIVFDTPSDPSMGMPPAGLGEKLKTHLDQGGSALILAAPRAEDLSSVLRDWGIEMKTNAMAVHEPIDTSAGTGDDFIEGARRQPPVFILNDFGQHPVADAARTLDAALVQLVPVKKLDTVPADVTVTPIIPIPDDPRSWGETDLSFGSRNARPPTFDKATDIPGPLFAGAVAEKKGKGRIVVIGSYPLAFDFFLKYTDPKLEKAKVQVARFPGNGELFANSVFWLTKNDKLMGLSPAAMDTARIRPMTATALNFWRWSFVMGLPILAVVCGVMVYQARRE